MVKTSLLLLSLLYTASVHAADPLTDAMQNAYTPYRIALFKTNSNSQPEAQRAIDQAREAWTPIARQYSSQAPSPYDHDGRLAASLAEVARIYDQAATQIGANELAAAHETLESARDVLAELRHRNNVVIFSDHMNAYHSQMEHVLIEGPKMLATAQGIAELTAQTGALEYLARRLESEAPAALHANADFLALLAGVRQSVAELKSALFAQDPAKIKETLGKIKAPYSKLFIKFG